jgi:hypothetical protein
MPPLVLTLWLDVATEAWLEGLRRAYFPPERNLVPAHVTLFHALPGREIASIEAELQAAMRMPPAAVTIGPARFTGRGVALAVHAPMVAALRAALAARFADWLTQQDRQGWRPHATVQNKVSPDVARTLHAELTASLVPREGRATGLRLWRYLGGPWHLAGEFGFGGAEHS